MRPSQNCLPQLLQQVILYNLVPKNYFLTISLVFPAAKPAHRQQKSKGSFFFFSFLKTLKPFSFFLNLNRWYSEKFLKGQWDKEECVSEWQKYQSCLSVICFISLEKKNLFFPLLIAISFKLLNF